jgi:hypothetical protein
MQFFLCVQVGILLFFYFRSCSRLVTTVPWPKWTTKMPSLGLKRCIHLSLHRAPECLQGKAGPGSLAGTGKETMAPNTRRWLCCRPSKQWRTRRCPVGVPPSISRSLSANLRDRVAGTTGEDIGRPTELTKEEEAIMVESDVQGTWGSPGHGRTSATSSRGTWTSWAEAPDSPTTCQGWISW